MLKEFTYTNKGLDIEEFKALTSEAFLTELIDRFGFMGEFDNRLRVYYVVDGFNNYTVWVTTGTAAVLHRYYFDTETKEHRASNGFNAQDVAVFLAVFPDGQERVNASKVLLEKVGGDV